MLGATVTSVTKQYSWRGELVGYRAETSFIPWAEGNTDFRLIRERIERNECSAHEPRFVSVRKVYGEDGKITGYDTDLGFVPDDDRNPLHQLLMQSACAGACVIEEPEAALQSEEIVALKLCNIFDRRWHHLEGSFERPFPYRPHSDGQGLEVLVRIRNIPSHAENVGENLRDYFDLTDEMRGVFADKPLQLGIVEVEVPTDKLQKLFRNERTRLPEAIKSSVEDSLARHLVRSGRSAARGPNTQWLLMEARYFLTAFFADIANMAVRAFTRQFGGVPPGHLSERDLLKSHLVLARYRNGQVRLHSIQHQREHSFALKGHWPDSRTSTALRDAAGRRDSDFWDIASRLRQLISAGFAIEAIMVANALIETVLKRSLVTAASHCGKAQAALEEMGHKDRLKLLGKLAENQTEPGFRHDEFRGFMKAAVEIYQVRNDYAHELTLPVENSWKIVDMDRVADRLLRFVMDPHSASVTMGQFSSMASSPTDQTISLILSELRISTE